MSIEGQTKTRSHALKKDVVSYNGNDYCVTVPSGVIMTRRKDKTMVAGNCVHSLFGVYLVNEVKKENPEWFDADFYSKINKGTGGYLE